MNLVVCFDKNAEAVSRGQFQLLGDVLGEIPDPGVCRHLEYLKRARGITGVTVGMFDLACSCKDSVLVPPPCRWGSGFCGRSVCCSVGWRLPPPGVAAASWAPSYTGKTNT